MRTSPLATVSPITIGEVAVDEVVAADSAVGRFGRSANEATAGPRDVRVRGGSCEES